MRGGKRLTGTGGILGLIMVGKGYRYESDNSLGICESVTGSHNGGRRGPL